MYVQQAEKLVLDKTSTLADCYTSRLRAELARFYGTLRCLRCWTMQHPLNPVSFTKCSNAFHSAISVVVFMFKCASLATCVACGSIMVQPCFGGTTQRQEDGGKV